MTTCGHVPWALQWTWTDDSRMYSHTPVVLLLWQVNMSALERLCYSIIMSVWATHSKWRLVVVCHSADGALTFLCCLLRHSGSCHSDGLILFSQQTLHQYRRCDKHSSTVLWLTSVVSVNHNELTSDQCCWMTLVVDRTWNQWLTALVLLCQSITHLTLSSAQSSLEKLSCVDWYWQGIRSQPRQDNNIQTTSNKKPLSWINVFLERPTE